MIRPALPTDLYDILAALPRLVADMNAVGNDQWSPHYPNNDHFLQDLEAKSLFVDVEDDQLRGFVALDLHEPREYASLAWSVGQPSLVVHRLAVVPGFQRRGVADGLLAFGEAEARRQKLPGLRSDTAEVNPAMNALFAKRGWRQVGDLRFSDATVNFRAWEKLSLTDFPLNSNTS